MVTCAVFQEIANVGGSGRPPRCITHFVCAPFFLSEPTRRHDYASVSWTSRLKAPVRLPHRVLPCWVALAVLAAPLAPPVSARAQTASGASTSGTPASQVPTGKRQLVGVVRDGTGAAMEGVSVAIPGAERRTDTRGAFELLTNDVDTVTIALRRIGFEPIDALLTARNRLWDTVIVQMEPVVPRLERVNVNETRTRAALGLRSFEERRARGIGQFVTRADIVERGSSRLSDVLRMKRGVNVIRGKVRFVAYAGGRSQLCQPDIWLDGTRSQGMEIDELLPSTVEAIELYPYLSTIPVDFQPMGANTTPCGTIVVWSRIPNGKAK